MERREENFGLVKIDLSLSFDEIGGYALPIVFYITIIFTLIFIVFHGFSPLIFGWSISALVIWVLPVLFIGIVLHELIHGVSFAILSGKPLRFVKYGFDKATLTPYAHCKTPIKVWVYKVGAVMPAIILGIIPFIFSIFLGNAYLFFFGTFFTTAACGDFIILWVIRHIGNKSLVEDHPKKAGCFVYLERESLGEKQVGLPSNAQLLQRIYKIPFIALVACTGVVFGYRVAKAISFYF